MPTISFASTVAPNYIVHILSLCSTPFTITITFVQAISLFIAVTDAIAIAHDVIDPFTVAATVADANAKADADDVTVATAFDGYCCCYCCS